MAAHLLFVLAALACANSAAAVSSCQSQKHAVLCREEPECVWCASRSSPPGKCYNQEEAEALPHQVFSNGGRTRFSPTLAWVCDAPKDPVKDAPRKEKKLVPPPAAAEVKATALVGGHRAATAATPGGAGSGSSATHYAPRILAALTSTMSYFEAAHNNGGNLNVDAAYGLLVTAGILLKPCRQQHTAVAGEATLGTDAEDLVAKMTVLGKQYELLAQKATVDAKKQDPVYFAQFEPLLKRAEQHHCSGHHASSSSSPAGGASARGFTLKQAAPGDFRDCTQTSSLDRQGFDETQSDACFSELLGTVAAGSAEKGELAAHPPAPDPEEKAGRGTCKITSKCWDYMHGDGMLATAANKMQSPKPLCGYTLTHSILYHQVATMLGCGSAADKAVASGNGGTPVSDVLRGPILENLCRASLSELGAAAGHASSSTGMHSLFKDIVMEHMFACSQLGFKGGFLRSQHLDWLLDSFIHKVPTGTCVLQQSEPEGYTAKVATPGRRLLSTTAERQRQQEQFVTITKEGCNTHSTGLAAVVLALFAEHALRNQADDKLFLTDLK